MFPIPRTRRRIDATRLQSLHRRTAGDPEWPRRRRTAASDGTGFQRRANASSSAPPPATWGAIASWPARSLRKRGYDVDDQAIFNLTYQEIGEKLKQRIADCDAVVCLIGFVYGGEPSEPPARSAPAVVHPVGVFPRPRARQGRLPAAGRRDDAVRPARAGERRAAATPAGLSRRGHPRPGLAAVRQQGPAPCRAGRAALPLGGAAAGPQAEQPAVLSASARCSRGARRSSTTCGSGSACPTAGRRRSWTGWRCTASGAWARPGPRVEYAWRHADDYTALLFVSAPSAGRAPRQPGRTWSACWGSTAGRDVGRPATGRGARTGSTPIPAGC